MAYSTGSATSQQDLLSQLSTFAVANGWTQDYFDTTNKWFGLHKGTVFVQWRWDATASTGGIAMFQSTGFINTGTQPGAHTNDSGSGTTGSTTPITSGRRISNIGNGPFVAHHFFTDASSTYIHVVLEYASGIYRHFSFGTITKLGTWTGGEYAVAHTWGQGNNIINTPTSSSSTGHYVLWDALASLASNPTDPATLHVEGLPSEGGSSKWGAFLGHTNTTSQGNDRAGNARITTAGGIRGGPALIAFGKFRANLLNGYIPLIPIPIIYTRSSSPWIWYLLGHAPDVRHVQMANINVAQEFVVGSDTWKVFPMVRKQKTGNQVEESWNAGIAYKKIP